MGERVPITHLKERNEVKHAYASHEKVKNVLGFRNTLSLQEAINRMAAWAKKVGARKSKEFHHIEVRKNLPEGWE